MATIELMQVREAARWLGVHENTLRRWEGAGILRAVRLPSGVRRFRTEDVGRLRSQIYGTDAAFHEQILTMAERSRPSAEVVRLSDRARTTASATTKRKSLSRT